MSNFVLSFNPTGYLHSCCGWGPELIIPLSVVMTESEGVELPKKVEDETKRVDHKGGGESLGESHRDKTFKIFEKKKRIKAFRKCFTL